MNKESSHRSHELKKLGWIQEDLSRYEELWEYSQRWGLINLERDDRQFLKRAEKLIPKIQPKKNSIKKSIQEKSYYLYLNYYLEKIKNFDKSNLNKDNLGVWQILLEVELRLLEKHKPVMGLPDTLKAKKLSNVRKSLVEKSLKEFEAKKNNKFFDFNEVINSQDQNINKSWKSLIENDPSSSEYYPSIKKDKVDHFTSIAIEEIESFMQSNYPSLKDDL